MNTTSHAPDDGSQAIVPQGLAREAIVSLRAASFGYADRPVVSGVTLDIHGGEVVAILGPNGSGKSTLVKGLLGLNDHLGGEAELFGTPVDRFRDHALLGYVPQRHTLSTSVRATVAEIVAIGRLPHQGWLARLNRDDRRIIAQSLAVVGLADRGSVDVSTLSGGQQRRVLIARALAAQPDVLIMDEPTAGVDLASQEILSQVLARLAGRGTTMLIVTHELRALRDILTRIVELDAGRIAFDGTSAEHDRWHDDLADHERWHGAPAAGPDLFRDHPPRIDPHHPDPHHPDPHHPDPHHPDPHHPDPHHPDPHHDDPHHHDDEPAPASGTSGPLDHRRYPRRGNHA